MRPVMRLRLLAAVVVAGIAVVVPAGAAGAHPLGNFTVNTYAGLSVETNRVAVDLVVDMAEIAASMPTGTARCPTPRARPGPPRRAGTPPGIPS